MAGSPSADEKERAALLVQHFGDRVLLVFSYFCFLIEFRKDEDLLKPTKLDMRASFILPAIQEACLITTLMAVRDLDDFLSSRGIQRDDLKASDFGFKCSGFLNSDERRRINKELIHSTEIAAYINPNGKWAIGKLATRCIDESLRFLKWLEANLSQKDFPKAWAAAYFYSSQLEQNRGHVIKKLGGWQSNRN